MRADKGFTLIELIVVCLLLPIVVGAITFAFVFILSQRSRSRAGSSIRPTPRWSRATSRPTYTAHLDHHQLDGEPVRIWPPILGLRWNLDSTGTYETTVSYVAQHNGTYSLGRNYCVGGSAQAPQPNEVAADIPSNQGPPAISYATG